MLAISFVLPSNMKNNNTTSSVSPSNDLFAELLRKLNLESQENIIELYSTETFSELKAQVRVLQQLESELQLP
jgi:hypothetical protein